MKGSPIHLLRFLTLSLLLGLVSCATVGNRSDTSSNEWDPNVIFTGEIPVPVLQETSPAPPPAVPESEPLPEESVEPSRRPGFFSRFRQRSGEETEASPELATDVSPVPVAAAQPVEIPQAYIRRVGDPVVIILSGPGLDDRVDAVIDNQGDVKLRYIGSVRAAGRTVTELEREIEAEYTERQQIYREVFATVHVPNRYYFIGGEVRQPGRYPLVGRVTLSQAIVAAGNFTEWARGDGRLTLLRNNERITILFRDITDDPTKDVELRTGDVITVDRRGVL